MRLGRTFDTAAAITVIPFLSLVVIVLVVFGFSYSGEDAIKVNTPKSGGIVFTTADGKVVAKMMSSDGAGAEVPFEAISPWVVDSLVAAEDPTFWSNSGVDPKGILRASWNNLLGNSGAGGASTITQQLVKNTTGDDARSIQRKVTEASRAVKTTATSSKKNIITSYLNTVFFGRNSNGIEAASHAYFGVPAADLTLSQGAFLAGVVQSPSTYDPEVDKDAAVWRWNYVMDRLLLTGKITEDQRAKAVFPDTSKGVPLQGTGVDGEWGHAVELALRELSAAKVDKDRLMANGATVVLTIDSEKQAKLERIAREEERASGLSVSVSAIDPRSGEIVARWSGDNGRGWDRVAQGQMTGSTMKLFALAAYLDQGGNVNDSFSSAPYPVGNTVINNSDGMTCGQCSVAVATRQSLNTSFMRIQDALKKGPEDTVSMAYRMGVSPTLPDGTRTLRDPNGKAAPTSVLGSHKISIDDITGAYGVIGAGGVLHENHIVRTAVSRDGTELYRSDDQGRRVLSSANANAIGQVLSAIAGESNGNSLAGGRKSGFKTGTGALGDTGRNRDAAGIGFTPQLAIGVWVGNTSGGPATDRNGADVWGATVPATLWKKSMDSLLQGEPNEPLK